MSDFLLLHEHEDRDEALASHINIDRTLIIPHGADARHVRLCCSATLREGDYLHIASLTSVADTAADLLRFLRHMTQMGIYVVFHKENFWLAPTPDDIQQAIFATLQAVITLEKNSSPLLRQCRTVPQDAHATSELS